MNLVEAKLRTAGENTEELEARLKALYVALEPPSMEERLRGKRST